LLGVRRTGRGRRGDGEGRGERGEGRGERGEGRGEGRGERGEGRGERGEGEGRKILPVIPTTHVPQAYPRILGKLFVEFVIVGREEGTTPKVTEFEQYCIGDGVARKVLVSPSSLSLPPIASPTSPPSLLLPSPSTLLHTHQK
jgi:hypothetical protein